MMIKAVPYKCKAIILICALVSVFVQVFSINVYAVDSSTPDDYMIELTDISNLDDGQKRFIYFGRPSCAFCQECEEYIQSAAKDAHQIVYYYNTDTWREHPDNESILSKFSVDSVPMFVYQNQQHIQICKMDLNQSDSQCINTIAMFIHQNKQGAYFSLYSILQNILIVISSILLISSIVTKIQKRTITVSIFISNTAICILTNAIVIILEWYMGIYLDDYALNYKNLFIVYPIIQAVLTLSCIILQFENKFGGIIHEKSTCTYPLNRFGK